MRNVTGLEQKIRQEIWGYYVMYGTLPAKVFVPAGSKVPKLQVFNIVAESYVVVVEEAPEMHIAEGNFDFDKTVLPLESFKMTPQQLSESRTTWAQ